MATSLIGGTLFGTAGAIVGSQKKRAIKSICSGLELRIYLNNLESNYERYFLIDSTVPVNKDSYIYKNAVNLLMEYIGVLKYIKENGNKEQMQDVSLKLEELKELFDKNLITEKEYEEKRKDIISKI